MRGLRLLQPTSSTLHLRTGVGIVIYYLCNVNRLINRKGFNKMRFREDKRNCFRAGNRAQVAINSCCCNYISITNLQLEDCGKVPVHRHLNHHKERPRVVAQSAQDLITPTLGFPQPKLSFQVRAAVA